MPTPPPDIQPAIVKGNLSEELLQGSLASPDLAVDTRTVSKTCWAP